MAGEGNSWKYSNGVMSGESLDKIENPDQYTKPTNGKDETE